MEFDKKNYDLIKKDLLLMVRESHRFGQIHGVLNYNFICLIPKYPKAESFGDYRPIVCANVAYKLISKIIARRLLPLMIFITEEQFGFIHNWHIHDVVSLTQEKLHFIKKKNLKEIILKLDLSKAYDRVD